MPCSSEARSARRYRTPIQALIQSFRSYRIQFERRERTLWDRLGKMDEICRGKVPLAESGGDVEALRMELHVLLCQQDEALVEFRNAMAGVDFQQAREIFLDAGADPEHTDRWLNGEAEIMHQCYEHYAYKWGPHLMRHRFSIAVCMRMAEFADA